MTFEEYKKLPKWKGKIFMKDEETCFNDGFEAGAKENGLQWHDLRKNPEDLPKIGQKVWIDCSNGDNGDWLFFKDFPVKTIAWCEIPQFKG